MVKPYGHSGHHADCAVNDAPEDDWRTKCDCSHEAMRARQRELERTLRVVLDSATPDPFHNPTMSAAWRHAQNVLENKR